MGEGSDEESGNEGDAELLLYHYYGQGPCSHGAHILGVGEVGERGL